MQRNRPFNFQKKGSKKTVSRNPNAGLSRYFAPKPPQISTDIRFTKKLRYVSSSAFGVNITRGNLLDTFVVPTTTSASYRIASSVRVVAVEMWGEPTASTNTQPEVSIVWASSTGPNINAQDRAMGEQPAHIRSSPPAMSLAAFWSDSGTNESDVIMVLDGPQWCIVDVTLEWLIQANELATLGPTSAAHLTVGEVTVVRLDGKAGLLIPDDWTDFLP